MSRAAACPAARRPGDGRAPPPTAVAPPAWPTSAASLTTPTGTPLPVTVIRLPAPASRARRTASASGRSSGTASVRRASRRATSAGSRSRAPGRRQCCGRPRTTGTARRSPRSRSRRCRVRRRGRGSAAAASRAPARATARPLQAATTVPRSWLPVAPHTSDFSTRPPSSGRPGTRLRTPTIRLAPASPSTAISSRPSGVTDLRAERRQAHGDRGQRARPRRSRTPGAASGPRPRSRWRRRGSAG